MVYTLRFFPFSKRSLFPNSNVFGSYIIQILYTGCAKIKRSSGAKRLIIQIHHKFQRIAACLMQNSLVNFAAVKNLT